MGRFSRISEIQTSRSGSGYGRGRRKTAFTTLKIAVLAPTPKARANIAMGVLLPLRSIVLRACLTISWPGRRAILGPEEAPEFGLPPGRSVSDFGRTLREGGQFGAATLQFRW